MVHGRVGCVSHKFNRFLEVAQELLIVQKMSLQLVQLACMTKVSRGIGGFLEEPFSTKKGRGNNLTSCSLKCAYNTSSASSHAYSAYHIAARNTNVGSFDFAYSFCQYTLSPVLCTSDRRRRAVVFWSSESWWYDMIVLPSLWRTICIASKSCNRIFLSDHLLVDPSYSTASIRTG